MRGKIGSKTNLHVTPHVKSAASSTYCLKVFTACLKRRIEGSRSLVEHEGTFLARFASSLVVLSLPGSLEKQR